MGEEGVNAFSVGDPPGFDGFVVGGGVEEVLGVVISHAGYGVFVEMGGLCFGE